MAGGQAAGISLSDLGLVGQLFAEVSGKSALTGTLLIFLYIEEFRLFFICEAGGFDGTSQSFSPTASGDEDGSIGSSADFNEPHHQTPDLISQALENMVKVRFLKKFPTGMWKIVAFIF
jgi:hypothetical protein